MEHVNLGITLLSIIGIFLISSFLQKKVSIPLPHSIITLSYLLYHFYPDLINLNSHENFDHIIFFVIPLILMHDAIHLKWRDIKTFKYSIAYLAVFSVSISILIGSSLYFFNIFTGLTIGGYVALFSMNMATDAISVSNIFSQFKTIPHNIKVLVEGESLGNDATAMIAFYAIGLPWILSNGSYSFDSLPFTILKTFGISTLIGLIVGFFYFYLLTLFNSFKEELAILIATAYTSFIIAEIIHVSGILSLIISTITLITLIENSLREEKREVKIDNKNKKALFKFLKKEAISTTRQKDIIATIDIFSFLSAIFVFILMASIIDIHNLILYWKEIVIMFIATTLIRMFVMAKFVIIGKKTKAIDYVGFNGWAILALAGIKGALSIIMLHAIPESYEFYKMFESVTIGVILLSTFLYGFMLLFYMKRQESRA